MDFDSRYTLLELFADTISSEEHCMSFEGIHLPQVGAAPPALGVLSRTGYWESWPSIWVRLEAEGCWKAPPWSI